MSDLAKKNCVPCRGGVAPLSAGEIKPLLRQLQNWEIVDSHHLLRVFPFPDFQKALDFVNKVGQVAEQQAHHPDLLLTWGKVEVKIWTHKIDGLTESDFILASKTDQL